MSSFWKNTAQTQKSKTLPLSIPCSTSFSSSHPSSSHFHIRLQSLLHHQPMVPPIPKSHWRPHSCLMLHPCPSQPAAPCWVKWSVLVSGETRVLSSAQLSWAASVINLLCDYCQSETPPPRRSALMGTMSPGYSQPWRVGWESKGGDRNRGEERTRRRQKHTVGEGE